MTIFYFSGTGNSLYIAKNIAKHQYEDLISISKEMNMNKEHYEYSLKEAEKIIFVYPIYAWGPPKMVLDFVSKLKLYNYTDNYICSISTCAENTGNDIELLEKKLNNNGLSLQGKFSVKMPNNYIISGDVDTKEVANKTIEDANAILVNINKLINDRKKVIFNIDKGPIPMVMTKIVNPLFNKFAIDTSKFYVTDDCIGCKICERVCNTKCINVNKVPIWGKHCTQCLACINYCPKNAIQYGKNTVGKGRYTNPYISFEEIEIK